MGIMSGNWTRRDLLKGGVSALGLLQGCASTRAGTAPTPTTIKYASAAKRPAYFVTIYMGGGYDPMYTTNPKTKSQVDSKVDVPFETNEIISAGDIPMGPHFKDLAPHASRLAILKGIKTGSVGHVPAYIKLDRLKMSTDRRMPHFVQIVGASRDEHQALPVVELGARSRFSSRWFPGVPVFKMLDKATPADREALGRALRREHPKLLSQGSGAEILATADHVSATAALLERYNSFSEYKPEPWPIPPAPYAPAAGYHNYESEFHAKQFQRVLWAIENDVAKSIIYPYHRWDSHDFNAKEQTIHSAFFVPMLARFFEELAKRKNHRGNLADNTVVLIATEMGRHPMLNDALGKDHLPEISVVVSGCGIKTGSKGAVPRLHRINKGLCAAIMIAHGVRCVGHRHGKENRLDQGNAADPCRMFHRHSQGRGCAKRMADHIHRRVIHHRQ